MKKPYIIANWKMNMDGSAIDRFFSHFQPTASMIRKAHIIICPSFVAISDVQTKAEKGLSIGAQNCFWEARGAYTGEVSARQLADSGCKYVIIGHSERRRIFSEDDAMINKKLQIALQYKLSPILCLGETFEEKEAGQTKQVVSEKVSRALHEIPLPEAKNIIIAYEPIWAISSNPRNTSHQADSPEEAQVVHKLIRHTVKEICNEQIAASMPIIYGGSIRSENAAGFAAMEDIGGVLVGSASRDGEEFQKIIELFIA